MGVEQIDTKEAFDAQLKSAGDNNKLVIVDFFATWCGPCKMIAPKIEEMSNKDFNMCIFLKVDVDINTDVAEEFAIAAMPTFLIFKKGDKVAEVVGASVDKVKEKIAEILEKK